MGTNAYNIFKTKPFDGFKMGIPELRSQTVIAIPKQRLDEATAEHKHLCVVDKTSLNWSYMIFKGDEIPVSIAQFKDKFGRGNMYQLYYFVWKPIEQLSLI